MAFANPWGHVFDSWGQNLSAMHPPVSIIGRSPSRVKSTIRQTCRRGDGRWTDQSRLDHQAGAATLYRQAHSSQFRCEIVSSRQFPPEAQGNFLINNVIGDRSVCSIRCPMRTAALKVKRLRRCCIAKMAISDQWICSSGPMAHCTLSTGTKLSSDTCSTTCAIPIAITRMVAFGASRTKAGPCWTKYRLLANPCPNCSNSCALT